MTQNSHNYHAMSVNDIMCATSSSLQGLTSANAAQRRANGDINELPTAPPRSIWRLLAAQFANPLMIIILMAAGVSLAIGHVADAIFIMVVIVINAILGFAQEFRAEKELTALQSQLSFRARVMRDGQMMDIDSREVVVGDILVLSAGDRIAADARMISNDELTVTEAALSGESRPIEKTVDVCNAQAIVTDRTNMVYASTVVEDGSAQAIVVATGIHTEIGRIAAMIHTAVERLSPLQRILQYFAYGMTALVLVIIAILTLVGLWRGGDVAEVLLTAIALVVSAVPEGLLPAITVVLVVGMRRLAQNRALVRHMSAVETMGAVSVICMDKTGTLTTGNMQVSHIFAGTEEILHDVQVCELSSDSINTQSCAELHQRTLAIGMIVNDALVANAEAVEEQWQVSGRPTDRALLLAALQSGLRRDDLLQNMQTTHSVLFSSERKYAMRVFAHDDRAMQTTYVLGAPEKIFAWCSHIHDRDDTRLKITDEMRMQFVARMEQLTQEGYRVLACADRIGNVHDSISDVSEEMTLVGIIALKDPVRTDVSEAIATAQHAGVRPIVITGDHRNTAEAILNDVGLGVTHDNVFVGSDIDQLTEEELDDIVRHAQLFARVLPEHKIRIVRALMRTGETVAMVGDGVNDAPALKAADAGIVVGSGTDLAKTVADIVLLDDSFATIVRAIREGRHVFANIRRVLLFLVADDFSELVLFMVAMFAGLPLPLTPAQILWINLIEDGLPGMALTLTKSRQSVMRIRPQSIRNVLWSPIMRKMMFLVFAVSGIVAIGAYLGALALGLPIDLVRTIIFVLMSIDSLLFVFVVATLEGSLFSRAAIANHYLNIAVVLSIAFLLTGIYLPHAQTLLDTVPLSWEMWGIILGIAIGETLVLEWGKRHIMQKEV
jgi:Ca2+-transporting ATPase